MSGDDGDLNDTEVDLSQPLAFYLFFKLVVFLLLNMVIISPLFCPWWRFTDVACITSTYYGC